MEDLTGYQFGPYRIVQPLGEGGMAAVYKAYQPGVDRYVAIKVLPRQLSNDAQFVQRFQQEARVLANLQHPHILPVFDFGESDGYTYIVMPFIEGGTLADLLPGRPLPLAEVERILAQVGDALDYAHGQGLVHRDIKPSNILIDPRGNCLLSDFGIAKLYEGTAHLTNTGGIIGTPAYMSPEQGQGQPVDHRSDIYSLGVLLYEMLTGRAPFSAETPIAVILKHIQDPLPPPHTLNPSIPARVEDVILKALAKQPQDRFATAQEMVRALRAGAGSSTHDHTVVDALPHSAPAPRWRRYMIPAVGAVLILLALGAAWSFLGGAGAGNATLTPEPLALQSGSGTPSSTSELAADSVTPTSTTAPATETLEPTETATPGVTPSPSPTPSITPTPGAGATRTNPVDEAQLVFIPAGQFTMGLSDAQVSFLLSICDECNADHFYASQPTHPVTLDAYWIYRTEVTNGMYARCVAAGSCRPPADPGSNTRDDYWGNPAYDDYPVVNVDWFSADQYCAWAGGRLPTNAEWEKAARGDDARIFPWGDAAPDASLANVDDRSGDNRPVGSYPQGASPFGVLDMAGNVWEWVADWHDINYYRYSPLDNPQGPESSPEGQRAGRGGNWYWHGAFASAAYYDWWEPDQWGADSGFRCVVDAAP